MNTREAIEKLPWLVNGSLDATEAAAVREQLAGSDECRAELAELAEAGQLFGARIPVETLLDYVAGRDVAPFDRQTVERYIQVSPVGSEEWRMATESWNGVQNPDVEQRGAPDADNVLPFRRRAERSERAARSWRSAAIAASILAVLGVGGWWSAMRDAVPVGFNPTIVEVDAMEGDLVLRDLPEGPTLVTGSTVGPVQLSLVSMAGGTRTLELVDADGDVAWAPTQEFVGDGFGYFMVTLPHDLDPGVYSVQLYRGSGPDRQAVERYSIELRE